MLVYVHIYSINLCFMFQVDTTTSTQHTSSALSSNQHVGTCTESVSVGVSTEAECLGPCEPGTSVTLEGIVWHETENGKNSSSFCLLILRQNKALHMMLNNSVEGSTIFVRGKELIEYTDLSGS